MHKLLQTAGAPEKALRMIDQVIDTCRPCRMWSKPSPISAATARLIERFNERVQHDLMFVSPTPGNPNSARTEPWQHMLDAATRLAAAAILSNRSTPEILQSLDKIWIRPYGAPTVIETDQEGGLISDEAKVHFGRIGTELKVKGVDAHVQMAEKHQDLLRQTFLRIFAQAQQEGIPITNDNCLTVALTAKNSLFTVGDVSPMMAVFGRQSPILPRVDGPVTNLDDTHTGPELLSRGRIRLQEIGSQAMLEATARKRMEIAARTKTRRSAQDADYKVGDQVEFHRRIQGKEVPGWRGPGEVLKVDKDGTTHIQWQGTPITCRFQDVRAALLHFIFFMCYHLNPGPEEISAWEFIQNFVSRMTMSSQQHIGIVTHSGRRLTTKASTQYPKLLIAILRAAACELHLTNCVGARLFRGTHQISGITGYVDGFLAFWYHKHQEDVSYWRFTPDNSINLKQLARDPTQLCSVQFLIADDADIQATQQQLPQIPHIGAPPTHAQPVGTDQVVPTTLPDTDMDRGLKRARDRADSDNPAPNVSPCLDHDDTADRANDIIQRAQQQAQTPIDELPPVPDSDDEPDLVVESDDEYEHEYHYTLQPPEQQHLDDLDKPEPPPLHTFFADDGFTPYPDPDDDDDTVELYVDKQLAHWFELCPRELQQDEVLVFVASKHRVSAVIKRVFDNLTPEDIKQHQTEVESAMFDELKRWHSLSTFRRFPRSKSQNPIDGTWILKWKSVKGTDAAGQETTKRVVKARLTARGFKDLQAFDEDIDTFAGTASKASQRMVNGFAAQHSYTLFSMDISAAFLKGLTFTEIAQLTGQPKRSVQFIPPKNCIHLLRRLPGMADYNPTTEVLDFLKAMWGLKDAPRLFGLRRDMSFRTFGATPTHRDPNFWVKRGTTDKGKAITTLLSTHLDDIKGGATDKDRESLQAILKKDFGDDLKSNTFEFEFTGVKHIQNKTTKEVYTHQDHYIAELSIIPLPPNSPNNDDESTPQEAEAFVSLLGALAWLLMTRSDISPYVGYMQRLAGKPRKRHLRMISQVLKYVKRVSTGLLYKRLLGKPYLLCVADSAYQANDNRTDCIALRGYFIFLACATEGTQFPGGDVQLIDFVSKKLHVISRSAFAAELRNTLEAAQDLVNTALQFHELYKGPFSAEQCAQIRDSADHFLDTVICTDSHGLYTATSKTEPSPGTDGSMVYHVKALRELLDNGNISTLCWIDNRDMIADGLTKGKPDRQQMNRVLTTGTWKLDQTPLHWSSHTPPRHNKTTHPTTTGHDKL